MAELGLAGAQRFLRPFALCDVAHRAQKRGTFRSSHGDHSQFHGKFRAVGAQGREFNAPAHDWALSRGEKLCHPAPVPFTQGGWNNLVGQRMPDDVRSPIAENFFGRRVEVRDVARLIHGDDAVNRGLPDGAAVCLGLGQRRLRFYALLCQYERGLALPVARAKAARMLNQRLNSTLLILRIAAGTIGQGNQAKDFVADENRHAQKTAHRRMPGWSAARARIGIRHIRDHHLARGDGAAKKIVEIGELEVTGFFVIAQCLLVEFTVDHLVPNNAFMRQHAQGGADDHADEAVFALRLVDGAPQEPSHCLLPISPLDIGGESFGDSRKCLTRAGQFMCLAANLQMRHHLPTQHPQCLLLHRRQRARHMVNDAQRAEREPGRRN